MPLKRNNAVTENTLIRKLPFSTCKDLAALLDITNGLHRDWKGVAALLPRRPGLDEPRYSKNQISIFEQELYRPGGSPTQQMLDDWGTTNAHVSDLLEVLAEIEHFAAMEALLPGSSEKYMKNRNDTEENHPEPGAANDRTTTCNPNQSNQIHAARNTAAPQVPHVSQGPSRIPQENTAPEWKEDSSCGLPTFDPQKVQRLSFEELQCMTNSFDPKRIMEGGSLIDEGGFGTVFRGKFATDEPCAVKKLKQQYISEHATVETQFVSELKALCSLRHPNLVVLYGYCYEPPNLCLIYELMTGGSLQDRLGCKEGVSPLTWPQRINIAYGAACGIKYLHRKGYIHRDIKSANILLDTNLTAKVCDFGLMRDKSDKLGENMTHFHTEVTIGSNMYMPHEAFRGEYSFKTDVFSFGVVLLEVLTGLPVFSDTHIVSTVEDNMNEHNNVVRLLDQKAHRWDEKSVQVLYDLAARCVNVKSKQRPDIREVVEALEDIQGMTPTL